MRIISKKNRFDLIAREELLERTILFEKHQIYFYTKTTWGKCLTTCNLQDGDIRIGSQICLCCKNNIDNNPKEQMIRCSLLTYALGEQK